MLTKFPRVNLIHTPTPFEYLKNLSVYLGGPEIYVKRDDCTGLAMGGNKGRQLEYYLGEAQQQGCDTIIITGAKQSNYMRMAAAAARKLGMDCHLQFEHRVENDSIDYQTSGNILLDQLFGATVHHYPEGEDEAGADAGLQKIAENLKSAGQKPYIIPLGPDNLPKGALGYVDAAQELIKQYQGLNLSIDAVITPSGSGFTHAGLLTGLRLAGETVPVIGACVRRNAKLQLPRVFSNCHKLCELMGSKDVVTENDIWLEDECLAPGYGQVSDEVINTIKLLARQEGILVDPVYSAKTFVCLINLVKQNKFEKGQNVIILHTGGTPALFAYKDQINF